MFFGRGLPLVPTPNSVPLRVKEVEMNFWSAGVSMLVNRLGDVEPMSECLEELSAWRSERVEKSHVLNSLRR